MDKSNACSLIEGYKILGNVEIDLNVSENTPPDN